MRNIYLLLFVLFSFQGQSQNLLKYVVYDFDGLETGQTDLPDGDFRNNDLAHSIAPNPLQASDVIGDRVLKLDLNWNNGVGEFGKATMRFLELNAGEDKLNFYFYNPTSNSGDAKLQVVLLEDDNGNNVFDGAADDKWTYNTTISRSGAWQLITVPLSAFQDDNAGGNGVFDARYTAPGGMLFSVGFIFSRPATSSTSDRYYIDMICFSDGNLPTGSGILDLPAPVSGAKCVLGALGGNPDPAQVPGDIHAFLPPGKKLAMVNWFLYYSNTGSQANVLPGNEVQQLLNNGYTPIITWESMYAEYARLDPVQPRLDDILNGNFDGYIDDFANKVKTYSGTVIMRIFHEFEGDWYSWSLTENGKDPQKYINAFRYVVDRFRNAGANNVQWMWCLNAEPKPYASYNWVVSCYPGDDYVDIVATDIYNHPNLGTPDWKSFRYTMAESYYYLVKYYSHKPLYVCEVGSRERNSSELQGSQSKGEWTCMMSKDLKSYFSRTQALVFFSTMKEHDWRINSSTEALDAFKQCIWSDGFFGGVVGIGERAMHEGPLVFPNPFYDRISLSPDALRDTGGAVEVILFDALGKVVNGQQFPDVPTRLDIDAALPAGVYVLELRRGDEVRRHKIMKAVVR